MKLKQKSKNYQSPRVLWEQRFFPCNILNNASFVSGFDDFEDGGELEQEP